MLKPKNFFLIIIGLALISLLFFTRLVYGGYTISGYVKDQNGKGLGGIPVMGSAGEVKYWEITNKDGSYTFPRGKAACGTKIRITLTDKYGSGDPYSAYPFHVAGGNADDKKCNFEPDQGIRNAPDNIVPCDFVITRPTPPPPPPAPKCQGTCTQDSNCPSGMVCDTKLKKCVNPKCPEAKNCICPLPPSKCQGACSQDSDCSAGLVCDAKLKKCVNPKCETSKNCVCPSLPPPVAVSYCLGLSGPGGTYQPGKQYTFTCKGNAQGTRITYYNFRVLDSKNQVLTSKKVDTGLPSAQLSYKIPAAGGQFTVQCQVCGFPPNEQIDPNNPKCTAWGKAN